MSRAWHRWRASVWLERLVAARRLSTWSPGPDVDARMEQCRAAIRRHLDALELR